MKLKNRFKKALFSFFKDEIMESVGFNGDVVEHQYITHQMKLTEIKAEIHIDENNSQMMHGKPSGLIYEEALEVAKKQIFEQSMKHIKVDTASIMDSHIYNGRVIKVSLFVGQTER